MTQEMERNLEYLQSSLLRVGFGEIYNAQLKADMAAGKAVIDLPYTEHSMGDKDYMLFRPRIVEKEDRPGFYIFPEIDASVYKNEKLVAAITVPHYKMTGMTVAQTASVLTGSVVMNSDGEDGNKKTKYYFSAIDFSKAVKEGQKHEVIRLPAKNHDLARLISKERFMGRDEEKAKVLNDLQSGLKTDVRLSQQDGGKYPTVSLKLALVESKGENRYDLGLVVFDREGTFLRQHLQEPIVEQQKASLRLEVSKKKDGLPGATLSLTGAGAVKPDPKKKNPGLKV